MSLKQVGGYYFSIGLLLAGGLFLTSFLIVDAPHPRDSSVKVDTQQSLENSSRQVVSAIAAPNNPSLQSIIKETYEDIDETFLSHNEIIFAPVITKLNEADVDSSFIAQIINHPETKFNDKFVKINVTGYLKKPDYSSHYNKSSVQKSKTFLNNNIDILKAAEKKYGVPAEAITSILWVETRHGGYTGKNQLPSVFLSTALASENEYIKMNLDVLEKEHVKGTGEYNKLKKKILSRAKKKSQWAIEQLVAMSKINEKLPVPVTEIKGSWAGAFGWSQFLPSSYESWAVDGNGDGIVDLFDKEDAIFSVANYLKKHGWGKSKKAQRKAVYGYNHSNDYVDAVLKLAGKIKL